LALDEDKDLDSIGFFLTEHIRMGGAYWCLNALYALKIEIPEKKKEKICEWIVGCQNKDGGFGGNTGHDSHITSTLYAILVLILFDSLSKINTEKVSLYVSSLQNKDGSFSGDIWGEIDTRFSYSGLSSLKLLNKFDLIDAEKAADFVLRCQNFDGSFGG